jgi:PAS domain S-box-containing protein
MAWSVLPDGAIDFVNQPWLEYSGLSLEEALADATRTVYPEDLPRVMEKWRTDMALGKQCEDEMRLRRADGEYRWFLVRTVPLRNEQEISSSGTVRVPISRTASGPMTGSDG